MANTAFKQLDELAYHPNWQKNGEKPCEMYKMEVGEEGRVVSKSITLVHYPIAQVVEFFSKPDVLKKLNPMMVEANVLHEVKGEFRITYFRLKPMWPLSERDIIGLSSKRVDPSGKRAVLINKSCNYPYPRSEERRVGKECRL